MTQEEKIQRVVEDLERRGLWVSWKIVHNYLMTWYPSPCPTVQEVQAYLARRGENDVSTCT